MFIFISDLLYEWFHKRTHFRLRTINAVNRGCWITWSKERETSLPSCAITAAATLPSWSLPLPFTPPRRSTWTVRYKRGGESWQRCWTAYYPLKRSKRPVAQLTRGGTAVTPVARSVLINASRAVLQECCWQVRKTKAPRDAFIICLLYTSPSPRD